MKKQERKKITSLKYKELLERLDKERKEALTLKMQIKVGKQKDLHSYSKKRKEIAVILTELKKKEFEKESTKQTGGKKWKKCQEL